MNVIKFVFYPQFIKSVIVPFIFLVIFLLIVFIMVYSFVKIELSRIEEERGVEYEEK